MKKSQQQLTKEQHLRQNLQNFLQNLYVRQKFNGEFQFSSQEYYDKFEGDLRTFKLSQVLQYIYSQFRQNPSQFLNNKEVFDNLNLKTKELKEEFLKNTYQSFLAIKEQANNLSTLEIKSAYLPQQIENKLLKELNDNIARQYQKNVGVDAQFKQWLQNKIADIFNLNITGSNLENYEKFLINQKKLADQLTLSLKEIQRLITQQIEVTNMYCQELDQKYDQCLKYILQQSQSHILEDLKEFPSIQYLIANRKKIQFELIYKGSEHGLNSEAYWKRCNLQESLLTIMISENGNIFGGYTPCLLDCTKPQYIQDPTLKSFIFQYNKRQIYRLKDKQYAVYANRNQGPTFGNGYDLTINSDFKQGNTNNLGLAYDTTNYQITDKFTHLFGDYNPKLVEVKVYRIK